MFQTSYIELDFKALKKNIRYLKKEIGKMVRFVSVIKGNAYGHGIKDFIPLAEACGIDYFAVSDAYEAEIACSVLSPASELMIMGMIDNSDLEWAIEKNISFYIFELDRLEHTILSSKKLNKKARIHLELETGLNRTGFENDELEKALELIKKNREQLFIEGFCTHYAGAENIANYVRIHEQFTSFNKIKRYLNEKGIYPKYHHTASSAATLLYPQTRMDMVRIGIAQFGLWPSKETKIYQLYDGEIKMFRDPLQQILQWKSNIMDTKSVKPAKFISYGDSFLTTKQTRIATVPIGYFHGFRRNLSNAGFVLIGGRKAPVIGIVNMNVFIVDISLIPDVKKGDEVVLIGKQKKNKITVASFSELTNSVNYELLTRLPAEIPRYVINKEMHV
ncbi:MAG: alanine racemase [Candidatus Cloacimonetes bacterium]|jgi:alanine racemase|nr:alanine racemase [Candidatus Cloacimonadota bacterium]